jgi:hypothetical protein
MLLLVVVEAVAVPQARAVAGGRELGAGTRRELLGLKAAAAIERDAPPPNLVRA